MAPARGCGARSWPGSQAQVFGSLRIPAIAAQRRDRSRDRAAAAQIARASRSWIPSHLSLELARVFACLISIHHLFRYVSVSSHNLGVLTKCTARLQELGFVVEEWFSASAERGEKGGEGLEVGLDWICL